MTKIDRRPIHRQSLDAEVAQQLRERIVHGDLAPGARLVEAEFCAAFGISRTPLREALKVLQSEGMVTIRPGSGAFVSVLSKQEVSDLFAVVADLERLAVTLAVERMTRSDHARMRHLHDQMIRYHRTRDLRESFHYDDEIHGFLARKSGNAVLAATHEGLKARARRGRYVALFSPQRWDEAMAEHETLIAAVAQGDAAGAGRIAHDHVIRTGAVLHQTLGKLGDTPITTVNKED